MVNLFFIETYGRQKMFHRRLTQKFKKSQNFGIKLGRTFKKMGLVLKIKNSYTQIIKSNLRVN